MVFFLLANFAGAVRPNGLKPFRSTGFPFTVAAWGIGVEEFFDTVAVALNAFVAITVSGLVALVCAWARSRRMTRPNPEPTARAHAGTDRDGA
jgi:hypothetical protein